jgi:hypothetical protein
MAILSKQDHGRSQVTGSTRKIRALFPSWFRVVGQRIDKYLNMRLGEETKGLQVEYHWMGKLRVDKKIFRALRW